jgi:hypothetical protein
MDKCQIYLLGLVKSNSGNKLSQEELTSRVTRDISKKLGPYVEYSESYRLTRFEKDVSELVSKGFLFERDGYFEMPWEAREFLDKFPRATDITKENILVRLHEYLNYGHALARALDRE